VSWTEIENSHLLAGKCNIDGCVSDTLAAPGQTENALCGPHRMMTAEIKIKRGGTIVQTFSAPNTTVPEVFRKKGWVRGDDGVIRDRWKRYVLPDPVTGELREYTRVSTLKEVFSNSYNIRMWDRRTSVYGLAKNPDLAAQAARAMPGADGRFEPNNPWRDHLDRVAKLAFVVGGGESGANNGTDWHRWRELFDATDGPLDAPEDVARTLEAREREMQRHGLTVPPGMSERVVIIPELDAAGTFDELFEAADVTLYIGDEKSQRAFYDGGLLEAIQLAAYSRAKWIVDISKVGNDPAANLAALSPMPAVDQNTAKIIWVPIGKGYAELKNVDLTIPWEYAKLAVRLRADRRAEWVTTAPVPAAPPVQVTGIEGAIRAANSRADLEALWHQCGESWTPEEVSLAQRHAAALDAEAERQMAAVARDPRAPEDVADAVLEAIERIAAEKSAVVHPTAAEADAVGKAQIEAVVSADICKCFPDRAEYCASSNCRGGNGLCKGNGHAWNCEKTHTPGVKTIREILVQRIEGLKGAPGAEGELTAMWQTQQPLGHWDDELTALGMRVLGR
jgi:hypothetical protein